MHLQHPHPYPHADPHPQEHKASLKQKHVDGMHFFFADYRKKLLKYSFWHCVHTCGGRQRKIKIFSSGVGKYWETKKLILMGETIGDDVNNPMRAATTNTNCSSLLMR